MVGTGTSVRWYSRLALALSLVAGSSAADERPLVDQRPRQPNHVVVLRDGLTLEARLGRVSNMAGPVCSGELRFLGDYVPGLLGRSERGELESAGWTQANEVAKSVRSDRTPTPRPGEGDMIVVLDPGHGGSEHGCVGGRGTKEKMLVLQIAKRIRRVLEEVADLQVILTRERDEDVALWDRVALANQVQADLFVSIHANAFVRPSFGGVETFFHSLHASDEEASRVAQVENAPGAAADTVDEKTVASILADMHRSEILSDSSRFAHMVQKELARVLSTDNLGVKQADFVVLRGTLMPAVLLELGFLTNRREERLLNRAQTQERIAQAVRIAVLEYRRLMLRKRVAPSITEVSRP